MNPADFNELNEVEKRHFYKCRCGEMVDRRQLDDVLFHETDHKPRPDIQYGGSVRIEEWTRSAPFMFTKGRLRKDKRGFDLPSKLTMN
jgi:hypothetical protein